MDKEEEENRKLRLGHHLRKEKGIKGLFRSLEIIKRKIWRKSIESGCYQSRGQREREREKCGNQIIVEIENGDVEEEEEEEKSVNHVTTG